MPNDDNDLKPVFNRLSGADRLKLRAAALSTAVSGVVRDDTKKDPWKFPFYAVYLAIVIIPIPLLGAQVVPLLLTVGWAKMGLTPWARWVHGRVKHCFNEEALVENHKEFIEKTPGPPAGFCVNGKALAKDTAKKTYADALEAARVFRDRYFG